MKTDSECIEIIRGRLTEKRFIHSLNVADCAKELAVKHGADPDKAYTAGILHDSCKNLDPKDQLSYLLENKVVLSEYELAAPKLFHAICGTVFAEKELGCTDKEILEAIRYHTTGRSNMTLLEKVVFIADFIGKERDYDGVEIMREKAYRSLDEAIVEGLSFTITDLIKKERLVHPDTLGAYNSALVNMKSEKGEKLI
ncbi:MAG: bis(5'-nucleosyl)-tetraphosphatase (symmetrical) YqeK [Clostridia bacterium]|nr:bis(5'-nucleosyl)-tetraphosphatase (symmetrical) YqeK [Clostridia bacterium]